MEDRTKLPQEKVTVLDEAYKQHEDFFSEFAKLRESQKETVAKLIHELYVKQQEETCKQSENQKN